MFDLAYTLGISVREVREMEYTDFIGWQSFFSERPVGWREDERTMRILQSAGVTEKATAIFSSLARLEEAGKNRHTEDDQMNALRRSSFFLQMLSATGGKQLKDVIGENNI